MIQVRDRQRPCVISGTVTEFSDSMGYCEHKIPFFMEGVKAPSSPALIQGLARHEEAEKTEKEKAGFVPVSAADLADMERDVEFAREDILTRLELPIEADDRQVRVVLYGRADKVYRVDGTLVVQEDKFPSGFRAYQGRAGPFLGQKLQALAYLNSRFADGQDAGPDRWFDISHLKKEWVVRIMDRETGTPFRIYRGAYDWEDARLLYSSIERFVRLVLGTVPVEHHHTRSKCRPCGFFDRCVHRLE